MTYGLRSSLNKQIELKDFSGKVETVVGLNTLAVDSRTKILRETDDKFHYSVSDGKYFASNKSIWTKYQEKHKIISKKPNTRPKF